MPKSVLSRRRSWVARLTVLAMVASLMVIGAAPASAALQDTSSSCPSSIPSAGFTDLGGLDAATVQAIDCLVFYDISKGTSATTYSPSNSVARWQMALFLTRQAAVHGIVMPDGSDQGFTDISGFDAETQKAINQLAQLDITKGTSATTFDPNGTVTRWQMALFVTRLVTKAGLTLGDGSSQGFTDIGGLDADTQKAINQLVQLGVSNGTSATTFAPLANTLRWHMALFLTRTLAAGGVAPSGLGTFVTSFNTTDNWYRYADVASCTTVKVTYKSTDSFFINGSAATMAAFETALGNAGNETVVHSGNSHILTTAVVVSSGTVATVATEDFTIQEPVSGNTLASYNVNSTAFELYVVDGVQTSVAGWTAALSIGDSVSVTGGDGTTAAKTRTYTLTNGTASGTVVSAAGNVITVDLGCQQVAIDSTDAGSDTYSVDGVTKTQAQFIAAVSSNDSITYSRTGSVATWTLTNQAPLPKTGKVVSTSGTNVDIAFSSVDSVSLDWTSVAALKVNGATATSADVAAAVSIGDTVVHQQDNGATAADESSLSFTDAAVSGAPNTYASPNITLKINGQVTTAVDVTSTSPANTGLTGTAVVYQYNGATVTKAVWDAEVAAAIANAHGTVTLTKSGNNLVWSLTRP